MYNSDDTKAKPIQPLAGVATTKPVRVWWGITLLLVAGLIIGLASVTVTATVYKNSLQTRINTVADALDGHRVTTLKDATDDTAAQSDYNYLKSKLSRLKETNADARFLYLMARDNNNVYFLDDSEVVGSDGYSPRGEPFPEATPALKSTFDTAKPFIEGPVRDSYGTWLSALAPVVDDQTYRITAVVGMDVPANSYHLLLGLAGGVPLLLAVLACVIVYIRGQTRRRHQESVQFRAEMISIASHELRTPLTGLRWSQENLLKQKMAAASQHRMIEIMYESTLRLQASIEDILQLASLESGKQQRLFKKETDLRELLNDVVVVQQLAAKQRKIDLTFSANWPKTLVISCDAQRLKRVFNNLVSNAIKYSRPDTTVTIGYGHTNDGAYIISVQDHGIGIPADERSKVWEGFYRASNTQTHDIPGTGMGLYLSRTIVEEHQGRLWLESEENKGTTIFVSLPGDAEHASSKSLKPLKSLGPKRKMN